MVFLVTLHKSSHQQQIAGLNTDYKSVVVNQTAQYQNTIKLFKRQLRFSRYTLLTLADRQHIMQSNFHSVTYNQHMLCKT